MDYIEEKYASGRITGQIKIHQKEDFDGMRKVGKLAADSPSGRRAAGNFIVHGNR